MIRVDDGTSFAGLAMQALTPLGGVLLVASGTILTARFAAQPRCRRPEGNTTSGMAVAMDLVLVTPIFMFFMLVILQWAFLMKDMLLVQQAAYSAARSAKVHLCPGLGSGAGLLKMRVLGSLPCTDDRQKAEDAARYVLLAAAPMSLSLRCEGACSPPSQAIQALARGTGTDRNMPAWQAEARYAFDPANVSVEVELLPLAQARAGEDNPGEQSARAKVSFRHVLLPWMEALFGDGRRSDGTAYAILVAEVQLT